MKNVLGGLSCLLAVAVGYAWILAVPVQSFAQGTAALELPSDGAAFRDSIRALLEQAQRLAVSLASQDTMPFGHDILARPTNGFGPPAIGAVDPGYPIGPGDEIIIQVWGEVELGYTLTVDREGGVIIPKVGRLQVGGIPLGELKGKITRFLSRAYSSIHEDPAEAKALASVSLGKLRSIEIFVVGEVRSPGAYALSGSATVLHALYRAAGPTPRGSLRGIRLVRHDRVVGTVDLYRFILDGDKSEDVRLQNGDVIHIPPSGHSIRLEGSVHRPAVYELKADEGLKRLLEIAGGLEPDAYAQRIQIERIVKNRERQIVDVDLAELQATQQDCALHDGDVISVFAIPETYGNAVTIEGFVARPGRYQLLPRMTVSQLVERCDGILPEAYLGRSDLVRTNPNMTRDLVSFHLGKALADSVGHNLLLQPRDSITVYSIHTFGDERSVTIDGLVRKPGRYELLDGMRLKDLIAMAGGLRDVAHKLEAEIARSNPDDARAGQSVQVHRATISEAYEANPGEINGFLLKSRDAVFIRENPDYGTQQYVTLQGRLRFPGVYALESSSERLTDIIERAGGLEEDAYPEGIQFQRRSLGVVAVDLLAALERPGGSDDLVLLDGDEINIPQCPHTVEIAGAVRKPTSVLFRPGKGVSYYLERAGGLKEGVSSGDIYVVRANGETLRSRRFLLWRRWPAVNPGTRIVVPPDGDAERWDSRSHTARESASP